MKFIESEFGRKLYKHLVKLYIIHFGEIPNPNIPNDILKEITNELKGDDN